MISYLIQVYTNLYLSLPLSLVHSLSLSLSLSLCLVHSLFVLLVPCLHLCCSNNTRLAAWALLCFGLFCFGWHSFCVVAFFSLIPFVSLLVSGWRALILTSVWPL